MAHSRARKNRATELLTFPNLHTRGEFSCGSVLEKCDASHNISYSRDSLPTLTDLEAAVKFATLQLDLCPEEDCQLLWLIDVFLRGALPAGWSMGAEDSTDGERTLFFYRESTNGEASVRQHSHPEVTCLTQPFSFLPLFASDDKRRYCSGRGWGPGWGEC